MLVVAFRKRGVRLEWEDGAAAEDEQRLARTSGPAAGVLELRAGSSVAAARDRLGRQDSPDPVAG